VDLSDKTAAASKRVKRQIQANMNRKRAADGGPVPPNTPYTVKLKGRNHRNVDTGALRDSLVVESGRDWFQVYVPDTPHPKAEGLSFHDVGARNQRDHPDADPQIKAAGNLINWFGITDELADSIAADMEEAMFQELDAKLTISGEIYASM